MNTKAASALVFCFAGAAVAAGDFNAPAWRGRPYTTTQGWDFVFGAAIVGSGPSPGLVATRNSNFLPPNSFLFSGDGPQIISATRQIVNFTDTYMTMQGTLPGENASQLVFAIPNYCVDETPMVTRIQMVYRGSLPTLVCHSYNGFNEEFPLITSSRTLVDEAAPGQPSWKRLSVEITYSQSWYWHAFQFVNENPTAIDIESIVIDTIVPAPGSAVLLGLCAIRAGRRRR